MQNRKCIKICDTGYNTNKEGKTMTEEQREQQQVHVHLRELRAAMLEKHGFKAENSDRTTFNKWYRIGTISGLEDYIPEPIDTEYMHTEIMDPTYLVYRVNLADETTEYAFVNYGENVNNVAFTKDAQDRDVFITVMQLIAKDQLFSKLSPSFQDVLETIASYDDFDIMQLTQDWAGIMVGNDFYTLELEKGQYVVRFEYSEDEPDSYFFITQDEAQQILNCTNNVEALNVVSGFIDLEVQI